MMVAAGAPEAPDRGRPWDARWKAFAGSWGAGRVEDLRSLAVALPQGWATRPPIEDAALVLRGRALDNNELHCNADASVAAAANLGFAGVLLHSFDAGRAWRVADAGPELDNLVPQFFDDPREQGRPPPPLYVSGALFTARDLFSIRVRRGPWLASRDAGRTWARSHMIAD